MRNKRIAAIGFFAIVRTDIIRPEMDGYRTTEVIQAKPGTCRLPIVALTSKAMKGDRENCLAAGASEYLAKSLLIPSSCSRRCACGSIDRAGK